MRLLHLLSWTVSLPLSSRFTLPNRIAKKPKPAADGVEGDSELLPLDPRQQALLQLEKDFELAMKSGKSTSRRRRKDEEDIVSARFESDRSTGYDLVLTLFAL